MDVGGGMCAGVETGAGVAALAGVGVAVNVDVGGGAVVGASEPITSKNGVVVGCSAAVGSAGAVMVNSTLAGAGNAGEAPPHPTRRGSRRESFDAAGAPQAHESVFVWVNLASIRTADRSVAGGQDGCICHRGLVRGAR